MLMAENATPTILLVDDTEASRYAVSRILRQARFQVVEATTGEEALRLAAEKPDLIILDVNLPDMSGYEVCQRIKAAPATASILVLHLSASFVGSEHRAEGLESGADGYLTYPLEPRELVANVHALLRIRQAERAMREQRELLRVTLGSIGDGVIATDIHGVVTFINAVARELIGWGEEAVGKSLTDIFHIVNEEVGTRADNPVMRVIRTGRTSGLANHTLLISRDGTRRPIDDTAAPILDEAGQFVGVVLVFRDITTRRHLEGELQRRTDALIEADRRKDEFLAMLAHELRNPLAPLRNTLESLKLRFAEDPTLARAGGVMERQVAHLVRLIDDLMDVSRITRGKFELRKERIILSVVLGRAVEAARPFLDTRQHRLEMSLPDEDVYMEADPARVEQIVANLLTNAAKYTPPGGDVHLSAALEGQEVVIRVRDNGIGIRPEMLPRLFTLFQQADRVPGQISEGLGIGLNLVRTLAEMHGGSVSASSPGPNQGSEFVVRLPVGSPGVAEESPDPTATPPANLRPLRVLVTDDNIDAAETLAVLLQYYGLEVRTAHDSKHALEIAEVFQPHVIFLDIALPGGVDGYELARRLRRRPGLESVLLIAMTGYGSPDDVQLARDAGFDHHLVKPADPDAVQHLLAAEANSRNKTA
jgi:PAS domain S-box-containing protein